MKDQVLTPTVIGQPSELQMQIEVALKAVSVDDQRKAIVIEKLLPSLEMGEPLLIKGSALIEEVGGGEPTEAQEKLARELRLEIRPVRTGAKKAKEEGKSASLNEGRGWDKAYNFIEERTSSVEDQLEVIEKYRATKEAKRLEDLSRDRAEKLAAFGVTESPELLAKLDESAFNRMLSGAKVEFEAAAAAKAEQERLAEQAAAAEIEKKRVIDLGYARMKTMATDRIITELSVDELGAMSDESFAQTVALLVKERNEKEAKEAEERKAQEAENARIKAEAEAAQLKHDEEIRQQQEAQRLKDEAAEKVLKAQQEEARIAREASAKLQAEADARVKAEAEAAESLKRAGDAEKLAIIQAKIAAIGRELKEMLFVSDAAILAKAAVRDGLETAYLAAKL